MAVVVVARARPQYYSFKGRLCSDNSVLCAKRERGLCVRV